VSRLGAGRSSFFAAAALVLAACGGEVPESRTAPSGTATTTAARADSNKALVARFIDDVWTHRNLDATGQYLAADLVNHAAIPEAQGAAGFRTIVSKLIAAFPDLAMRVSGIATEGDDVIVVRAVMEGTQTGDLAFKTPIPATNKHIKVDQVHTFRIKDGRIVETWMVMDHLDLLSQLGVQPKPPGR
jgi:predicted ester cyclase